MKTQQIIDNYLNSGDASLLASLKPHTFIINGNLYENMDLEDTAKRILAHNFPDFKVLVSYDDDYEQGYCFLLTCIKPGQKTPQELKGEFETEEELYKFICKQAERYEWAYFYSETEF